QLESVQNPLLWLLFLAVGAGVMYWAYLEIFQRTERRLTWALFTLRAVGLCLLVLALAKPTWTRESDQVDPGHVAVILDNSRSMSLPDADGQTRYARATSAVKKLSESLIARRGPRMTVDLFDVNGVPLKSGIPER